MEAIEHEEVEAPPSALDDAENATTNEEEVVMTRNEEDDQIGSKVSAVEAAMDSQKDDEMDTAKGVEMDTAKGVEKDTEKGVEIDTEKGLEIDSEKGLEIDKEKGVEMDTEKGVEVDTEKGVETDTEKGVETDVVKGVEMDTEKGVEMDTGKDVDDTERDVEVDKEKDVEMNTEDVEMNTEKDVEMDTVKHEEAESVPLDEEEEEEDEGTGGEDEAANATTEIETETDVTESGKASAGKRKRKNIKSSGKSKSGGRASRRKTIGEDVCFICFDGGDLVLCDRRGCTKAYHPSCIDRDEDFFRAKGLWNCGWHQCTICQKNAYYFCYTCTFSLCKGCSKDDVILCVRGNKGFCKTCIKTVRLIEGLGQEDKDGAPIDFDDKSSFEYLFKDYLMDLKAKLSLSSDEIADAKSPRKGSDVSASRRELVEAEIDDNDDGGSGSDASIETLEASKTKKRKTRKWSKSLRKEEAAAATAVATGEGFSTAGTTEWASKELLEFVKHMKNGDVSVLSQFDVQALLLEYIKTNKLRDPRRKSQIICDSRLESLFGKPRVGHFEMLKLLESHFLMKEDSQIDDVQGSVVDTEVNHEADANSDTPTRGAKDRKRKRKKGENRGRQSNLDEFAAIDVHNISLIYLRRKLVEDLLEENDKFQEKIAGTFVRIRISGNVQKNDLYRLVQVVGTSKAAEPYKLGKRTTDIVLEILNLNKTELLSIDTISNQDFTEEECKRLRQSIRCGLINRLTVGDILDKALEIQAARVNDWLESEILRLSHLRDRASEKGKKKELRECVEKLQILKTPDERSRRLDEVPEVHADPKMDPRYESDDEDSESNEGKRDAYMRAGDSSFSQRGRGPVTPKSDFTPKDSWVAAGKNSSKNWELNRSSGKNLLSRIEDGVHSGSRLNDDIRSEVGNGVTESKNPERLISVANSNATEQNSQFLSRMESFSGASSLSSPATFQGKVAETSIKINEAEKMWHYKDPSGKIQGPFSVVQLRKWSNTGYFPADLRIWKTTDKQEEDSILLTDALAGKFEKAPSAVDQNVGHQNSPRRFFSSGGGMTSVEVSSLSTEKWSNSDSLNLPSPTPKQDKTATSWVGGDVPSATDANLYPSNDRPVQSRPALADGGHSSASAQNSSGNSVRGPENNYVNSGSGPVPATAQGHVAQTGYSLQNAQPFAAGEHQTALVNSLPGAQDAVLHSDSLNLPNPSGHGAWVAAAPKGEPNISALAPGQLQGYSNWGTAAASIQNLSVAPVLPQSDYWRAPAQGQPNIQPTTVPSVPWGVGLQENTSSASALRPENNSGWGMMPVNPSMGWGGPVPPMMNVNWGATVQAMPPGNTNPGWVSTGPVPGSSNPGWSTQSGIPGVPGLAPGNANPGWIAPTVSVGSTMGTGNTGAVIQGPTQGDSNLGKGAATGSRGTRNNDRHQDRRFSGQSDRGYNDRGYNDRGSNRGTWNRQSSSGSRGPGGSSRGGSKKHIPCPYNTRCTMGSRCNYLH